MQIVYQNIESKTRGYQGAIIDKDSCSSLLKNQIKNTLLDIEQRESLTDILNSLQNDTGFIATEGLLVDIQALENTNINVQPWRVGEAMAEIVLENEFQCRFHWNELRDARNPKGNKTGADLVGFIEIDEQILFLFGEVKTSSETSNIPPQVMTNAKGVEKQLKDLHNDSSKRLVLISYLQNKVTDLQENHQFKKDFNQAIRNYYSDAGHQLIGVLVRDVEAKENDIKPSYERLKKTILEPQALNLIALYIPLEKENWLSIINEEY